MGKPSISVPPEISDHELLRPIGKGSYGEVWLARTQMGTYRAVKIVHGERFGDDERPFERELEGLRRFEPISRSHAGLVGILHFGRNSEAGYFYYVMELADDRVRGTDIDPATYVPRNLAADAKQRGRWPVKDCVELALALSDALHKIHSHGLVHRDIKPSNIIFVNGVPKLADVGLVTDAARANSYVGTEGFIAPEGPGSAQGDIYALGKLLYEISTGKDRTDFPTLPADVVELKENGFIELNEVLIKACHTDPGQRYQSAKDLEADLALLKRGESVRRLRMLERLLSQIKKAAAAGAILFCVAALVFFGVDHRRKQAAEIRQLQLGGHLADGAYALNRGDYAGSLAPFLSAFALEEGDANHAATHRLRLKSILDQCPKLEQMFFHDKSLVNHAAFSRDGRFAVTTVRQGKAQVWDMDTGKEAAPPLASGTYLESASISSDGSYVITGDEHGRIDVWERRDGKHVLPLRHEERALNWVQFSPDDRQIVSAGGRGVARVWEFPSGRLVTVLSNHTTGLTYAGYSPDGQRMVTTGKDGRATILDARTFAVLWVLPHKSWVYHADFSPNGRLVVTASFDRKARLWDLETGAQLYPEMSHGDGVGSARFSPDGRYIVTACMDGVLRFWEVETRQPMAVNAALPHGDRVMDASFHPDGRRVLSACADGTARIWDLAGGMGTLEQPTNFYSLEGAAVNLQATHAVLPEMTLAALSLPPSNHVFPKYTLSRNGRFALEIKSAASNSFRVQGWNVRTLKPVSTVILTEGTAHDLSGCISEDGRYALLYSRSSAALFDLRANKQSHAPYQPGSSIGTAVLSPDARYFAVCAGNGAAVFEIAGGAMVVRPELPGSRVRYLDFSGDSQKLVLCSANSGLEKCRAEIWFPGTKTSATKPLRHGDGVLMAAFSRDSRWVVTASEDFYASVWNAVTGEQSVPSLQHEHKVYCANFSRSGEWLVTADAAGNVRLWDGATRKPLSPPLRLSEGTPYRVRFVENDTAVFVTSEEGRTWLWRLAKETRSAEELARLYELVGVRGDVEANRFRTSSLEHLRQAWVKFTREHPNDFKTSKEEILAWHQREWAQALANGQTEAAQFHSYAIERAAR